MTERTAARLIAACTSQPDGFVSMDPRNAWRVGVVAHIRRADGSLALIRKAAGHRRGYEFAGKWAMPGGMLRIGAAPGAKTTSLVNIALASRARAEAGLDLEPFRDEGFEERLGPLITSYATATGRRSTLVLVRRYVGADQPLAPQDPSVDAAAWLPLPPNWAALAPANLLALAHITWSTLSAAERADALLYVHIAAQACSGWARQAGVTEPAVPWDEAATRRWRRSFP